MDVSENTELFEYLNVWQFALNFLSMKAFLIWNPVNSYNGHKYVRDVLATQLYHD